MEKTKNNSLYQKIIIKKDPMSFILDGCNIKKALEERDKAIRRENEEFDRLYDNDGLTD